ncbi:hypothetical protein DPEC_G00042660 [Dallia pectoralis]|uniref:Uncharacterized protein n=1 Tax=Dallia pectoralis TaxID=75939 RepID=A0ACC2H976_DALPE|nr:hypothetical protein DPEC_G00042660 [Dallia pectoralis]
MASRPKQDFGSKIETLDCGIGTYPLFDFSPSFSTLHLHPKSPSVHGQSLCPLTLSSEEVAISYALLESAI